MASHEFLVALALLAGSAAAGGLIALALRPWLDRELAAEPLAAAEVPARPASWETALSKTRGGLARRLIEAWHGPGAEGAWLAEAEEALLTADVGVQATRALLDRLAGNLACVRNAAALRRLLRDAVRSLLAEGQGPVEPSAKPWVILVVGVNGVGKTTTIGKLAYRFKRQGRKVLLVAGDTFRAAAIEQLERWARRSEVGIVRHQHGADPSAVAFDGMKAALARDVDVVLVDTAGRLHVKENLMEELKKIQRTIGRLVPGAPQEVLLVVDATTGQNALNQARVFHAALELTGVALAKLDGSAKGGIALAIRSECGIPIRLVGLGEGLDDLAPFDADSFADALFESDGSVPLEQGPAAV